jgi:hypothetical protein
MRAAWIWRRWVLDLDLSIKTARVSTEDGGAAVAEGGGGVMKSGVEAIACWVVFSNIIAFMGGDIFLFFLQG